VFRFALRLPPLLLFASVTFLVLHVHTVFGNLHQVFAVELQCPGTRGKSRWSIFTLSTKKGNSNTNTGRVFISDGFLCCLVSSRSYIMLKSFSTQLFRDDMTFMFLNFKRFWDLYVTDKRFSGLAKWGKFWSDRMKHNVSLTQNWGCNDTFLCFFKEKWGLKYYCCLHHNLAWHENKEHILFVVTCMLALLSICKTKKIPTFLR